MSYSFNPFVSKLRKSFLLLFVLGSLASCQNPPPPPVVQATPTPSPTPSPTPTPAPLTLADRENAELAAIDASTNGNFPLAGMKEIQLRGGIPNVYAKLQRGEPVTIAYYGTSVTAPAGWRQITFDWFKKQYPKSKLTMVNGSVGGTGSLVGVFRADHDLISKKPDLVFIEFAGNDNADARSRPRDVLRSMEGIVRKLLHSNPKTDICLAYAFGGSDLQTLLAGNVPRGGTLHEMIAEHYQLPSIEMSLAVAKLERDGKLVNQAPMTPNGLTPDGKIIFTKDGSHPTIPLGHSIWAGTVETGLEMIKGVGTEGPHDIPAPLLADNWELAKTVKAIGNGTFTGTWEKITAENGPKCEIEGVSIYNSVPVLRKTVKAGSSFSVTFKGTEIGIKGITGPDSGFVNIQVDDKPPEKECQFTVYSKSFAYGGRPLAGLPDGQHTATWTFLDEKPDKLKILASYNRKGNEQDMVAHPEKYAKLAFYVGEILLVGEIIPPAKDKPADKAKK